MEEAIWKRFGWFVVWGLRGACGAVLACMLVVVARKEPVLRF